jgi:signal transduction histidine kinase
MWHLPLAFWGLLFVCAALGATAAAVLIHRPSAHNAMYAGMALGQCGNLLCMATIAACPFGTAPWSVPWILPVSLDLISASALVHAVSLYPRRLPRADWTASITWGLTATMIAWLTWGPTDLAWWSSQALGGLFAAAAIGLLSWSNHVDRHPSAIVLRRYCVMVMGAWLLMTAAAAAAAGAPVGALPSQATDITATVWVLFNATVLLALPVAGSRRRLAMEFVLVAAAATMAVSTGTLLTALVHTDVLASMALSVLLSFILSAALRPWLVGFRAGRGVLTPERMFERLYRITWEVEARPERTQELLLELLKELFEPLEWASSTQRPLRSRVSADGSTLRVPVPELSSADVAQGSVTIRLAFRGRRLFTLDDARLTDRVVEQLQRAIHFDRAVERGRSEERTRLAQDLHDDIGARLLTLMYKAQSPEMEDYVRHTLQDLKTLTRGLAASNHMLSHATAEWKSDLAHRLTAASVELNWSSRIDEDITLSVVQWSALTRVLREIVSNAIAHSGAHRVDVVFRYERQNIDLMVVDDGIGRQPGQWAHGLGIGGIRKRVKQLGGTVEWRENLPKGIVCQVQIATTSPRW